MTRERALALALAVVVGAIVLHVLATSAPDAGTWVVYGLWVGTFVLALDLRRSR